MHLDLDPCCLSHNYSIVVLDIETTGSSGEDGQRVVEVGAHALASGYMFRTLVNPFPDQVSPGYQTEMRPWQADGSTHIKLLCFADHMADLESAWDQHQAGPSTRRPSLQVSFLSKLCSLTLP